jgi:hypothetical protein
MAHNREQSLSLHDKLTLDKENMSSNVVNSKSQASKSFYSKKQADVLGARL